MQDIVSSTNNQALLSRQMQELSIKEPELRNEFEVCGSVPHLCGLDARQT